MNMALYGMEMCILRYQSVVEGVALIVTVERNDDWLIWVRLTMFIHRIRKLILWKVGRRRWRGWTNSLERVGRTTRMLAGDLTRSPDGYATNR